MPRKKKQADKGKKKRREARSTQGGVWVMSAATVFVRSIIALQGWQTSS
jgi:hypothetical protein